MDFVELRGVDHRMVLRWSDWEELLSLAYRVGWRTTAPGPIVFRPRQTVILPRWASPGRDGETRTASAWEARQLAESLRMTACRHRRAPPAWWHRNQAGRLKEWPTFLLEAWEVIYLLGGGSVSVAIGETILTA
jgi:hypothetical protein